MARKRLDYVDIYLFLQEHTVKDAAKEFGASEKAIAMVKNIGDALLSDKPKLVNAKPLDKFTPRELMEELARRGYRGKLAFTQEIDITSF